MVPEEKNVNGKICYIEIPATDAARSAEYSSPDGLRLSLDL
jgi:hypothetical protein